MATEDERVLLKHEREVAQEGANPVVLLVAEGTDLDDESLNCIGSLLKGYKKRSEPDPTFLSPITTDHDDGNYPPVDEFGGEFADDEALDRPGGQLGPVDDQATDKSTDYAAYLSLEQPLGGYDDKYDVTHLHSSELLTGIDTSGAVNPRAAQLTDVTLRGRMIRALSDELLRHNRFTPTQDGAFLPVPTDEKSFDAQKGAIMQALMGVHKNDGPQASFEMLSKIGSRLMHRAVGIDVDDPDTFDGEFVAEIITAMFTDQAGVTKLDPSTVEVSDLSGLPISARLKGEILDSGDFDPNLYGINPVMNTDVLPFGGFAPIGMIALALALSAALSLLFKVIFFGFSWLKSTGPMARTDRPGKYIERHDEIEHGVLSLADIGIRDTTHPWGQAVNHGINVFFGLIDFGKGGFLSDGDLAAKTSARVTRSPGYYAIMCRQILKGGNDLAGAFSDIGKSTTVSATQNVLNLADELQSSKLIAAMNMFASLGDIALTLNATDIVSEDGVISRADNDMKFDLKSVGISRVAKGRVDGTRSNNRIIDRRQTISTGLIPSMLVLPQAVENAADLFGGKEQVEDIRKRFGGKDNLLRTMLANKSKFTADEVANIEAKLEAEYMPFYFQDLRTNEIVAFHAFLNQLNENYSVKYEETNAYGRIDPVMTYANTRRAVSMKFIVAAMGPTDFDEMWLKINKLMTLIYPQWSKGRQVKLNSTDELFIQPFSQIPSAGPLIRLRLGDLLKSNYTRFALARLFGAGTESFTIGTTTTLQGDDIPAQPDSGYDDTPTNTKSIFEFGDEEYVFSENERAWFTGNDGQPPGVVTVTHWRPQPRLYMVASKTDPAFAVVPERLHVLEGETPQFAERQQPVNPNPSAQAIKNARTEWFNKDKNAIVAAFEASGGQGLAGVITSMSFDWFDAVWEIDPELGKAPQWCTISIEFQPIHDIAPGIDSNGYNRAPIYNVGSATRDIGRGTLKTDL